MALVAASLSLFINYIIGKPGGEFSPYEIFSSYTVWLSRWRLKRYGLYKEYKKLKPTIGNSNSIQDFVSNSNDFNRLLYNAAEPYFTWERAFGMCVVCTGVWISLGVGIVSIGFTNMASWQSFLSLIEIIVFSHIIIRILAKII